MSSEKRTKSEETVETILNAALKLFLEEGYEKATMRSIARSAGLSVGAAYYYFPTKEHIIFEFYKHSFQQHLALVRETLATTDKLEERIAGVTRAQIDVAQPYHSVSKALFRVAVDPHHPLSPLSDESKELREGSMMIYREAIDGASGKKFSGQLGERLPELFWIYRLVIILYWLFDDSEGRTKTYALIDKSASLLVKVLSIASMPIARSLTAGALKLFDEFKPYR